MVPRTVSRIAVLALAVSASALIGAKTYPYVIAAKGDRLEAEHACADKICPATGLQRYATSVVTSEAGLSVAVRMPL